MTLAQLVQCYLSTGQQSPSRVPSEAGSPPNGQQTLLECHVKQAVHQVGDQGLQAKGDANCHISLYVRVVALHRIVLTLYIQM